MANIPGTVVAAKITTGDTVNTYAIGDCNEMQGTVHSVADNTARDAITTARRREGMYAYVISTQKTYQLVGGVTNSDWVEVSSGGSSNATSIINSYTAGESISAYNILVQESDGKVDVGDSSDTTHIQKVVGLATTSAVLDDTIEVQSTGKMTNAGWSWTPGAKLYYTSSGTLTETVPSTGFIQQVAVAETATTITINLGLCIAL
jgi:hypothetical protein